jgi:hypothetical protein
MASSDSFSETIKRLVRQFLASASPDPLGLRQIVSRMNALPLFLDMGGCIAASPGGEIISFLWDEPLVIRVETCPRIRNLALFQVSKKYSALREFIPPRPEDAVNCPHCKGKGELPAPMNKVVCYCGGVRWLPVGNPVDDLRLDQKR